MKFSIFVDGDPIAIRLRKFCFGQFDFKLTTSPINSNNNNNVDDDYDGMVIGNVSRIKTIELSK